MKEVINTLKWVLFIGPDVPLWATLAIWVTAAIIGSALGIYFGLQ